jgi:hypothetical protein
MTVSNAKESVASSIADDPIMLRPFELTAGFLTAFSSEAVNE